MGYARRRAAADDAVRPRGEVAGTVRTGVGEVAAPAAGGARAAGAGGGRAAVAGRGAAGAPGTVGTGGACPGTGRTGRPLETERWCGRIGAPAPGAMLPRAACPMPLMLGARPSGRCAGRTAPGRGFTGIDMRACALGWAARGPGAGRTGIGGFHDVRPVAVSTYTCLFAAASLH